MPPITPNLLLIDSDSPARQQSAAMLSQFPCHLMTTGRLDSALQMLADNLMDLIVCDLNVITKGYQTDAMIARFHRLPGRNDVPVLFTCGLQRSGVTLKKHAWGVAYHVNKSVKQSVLLDLIRCSLSLRVQTEASATRNDIPHPIQPNPVPAPFGLTLPEVIMPPHGSSVSF